MFSYYANEYRSPSVNDKFSVGIGFVVFVTGFLAFEGVWLILHHMLFPYFFAAFIFFFNRLLFSSVN